MNNTKDSATNVEPTLYIEKRVKNPSFPGAEIVEVWCPSCARSHTHGLPDGPDQKLPTHRGAHCSRPADTPGYWIDEHPEVV
jgi:hypothetical protein